MNDIRRKVAFHTLGCKVNQYDTQAMTESFIKAGWSVVDFTELSDVYIVNTCSVTAMAETKSKRMIRRVADKGGVVVAAGCFAQRDANALLAIDGVNLAVGSDNRADIVEHVKRAIVEENKINMVEDISKPISFEEMSISSFKDKTRAILKVQEGCNNFCAYCIIPYLRGRERCRRMDMVTDEAGRLADNGFKEIIMTGIHVSSYKTDDGKDFVDLLSSINDIKGIERIRLGSLEPWDLDDKTIERMSNIEKLCPHFHISLQSGSDNVLERMQRRYDSKYYMNMMERIRHHMPDAAITTDIIAGFPGESEEEFAETVKFIEKAGFSAVHIFPFSVRPGTKAEHMPGQLPKAVKKIRAEILIKTGKRLSAEFKNKFIGRQTKVLFEERMDNGRFAGFNPQYIRIEVGSEIFLLGEIKKVWVNTVSDGILGGIINK